jgi:hypothetical protein
MWHLRMRLAGSAPPPAPHALDAASEVNGALDDPFRRLSGRGVHEFAASFSRLPDSLLGSIRLPWLPVGLARSVSARGDAEDFPLVRVNPTRFLADDFPDRHVCRELEAKTALASRSVP